MTVLFLMKIQKCYMTEPIIAFHRPFTSTKLTIGFDFKIIVYQLWSILLL